MTYEPKIGLRNNEFSEVEDICNLSEVATIAKQKRIDEAIEGLHSVLETRELDIGV